MPESDLLDFLPLFPDDDEETILERMREWANEGLDPDVDVDEWVDTREGSHWYVGVMPCVRELARLYDLAGTEVVAAGMPVWAWGDYLDDHAEVQDITRLAATHADGTVVFSADAAGEVIAAGTTVGVEPQEPNAEVPEFEVTEGGTIVETDPDVFEVELPVRALEAGVAGNVAAEAVQVVSTPGVDAAVINPEPIEGGTEPETDESLRERVIAAYTGQGAGNKADYERWGRAWVGVGRVTVIPLWNGPGTVKLIVTTAEGLPVSQETIDGLQADLDPDPGMGEGRAPIGAIVTVGTATARNIEVGADVEFEGGFTLDGAGGTVALREAITTALRDYIERVESGGEVVIAQVAGRIVTVAGVHDVSNVTLEGAAVNVAIDDDPAETPVLTEPVALVEV